MIHYRQTNGIFHASLPDFYWLSPINKVLLTEQNALEYGYEPAINFPQEYGVWLIESGIWLAEINKAYSQAVAALVADVPEEEQKGWGRQEAEARAYVLDSNASTPYVDGLVASRSAYDPISKPDLVNRILAKVALYEAAHSYLTGLRQGKEKALEALDPETVTHVEVFAIDCNYAFPEAQP